jgi:hypothetical protein
MGGIVIRGTAKIKGSLGSGAGDELLTKDVTSGELGTVSGTSITALQQNYIFVGNASNLPAAVPLSGDATIVSSGALTIANSAITNAKISASAAIELSKLAALTASRAIVSDGSGVLSVSSVTGTELGYVSGASSNLQTQINAKQATITGAASTVVSSNLTANRAVVSGTTGKLEVSSVTLTELGYVSGVTSGIQTQLGGKLSVSLGTEANGDIIYRTGGSWTNLAGGSDGEVLTMVAGIPSWSAGTSNGIPSGGTTAQYLRKSSNTDYAVEWHTAVLADITDVTATYTDLNLLAGLTGTITNTELSYLAGLTSNLQTQLNAKQSTGLAYNAIWVGDASNVATQLSPGSDGQVLTSVSGVPQWQTPSPPGDVTGPVSATDNAVPRWNTTSGDSLQDSGVIIDDSNNVSGIGTLSSGQHSILNQAALRLYETGSTNYVAIRAAGTMASDYTITLPAAAPGSNTYLKYDGTNYVWATASGGGGTALQQKEEIGTTYTVTDADDGYVIYFTNVAGCTVTLPNTISTDISFTTVRADGAGVIAHVVGGSSVLFTIGGELDIEDEYGAATWVKKTSTDWYGWGSLGPAGGGGGGSVNSVSGTANRISIGGTSSDPVVDIAATYIGQTSITTLGTIATGTWNATAIGVTKGGTGLTALGTANQLLRVNAGATALEYFTPSFLTGNETITLSGDLSGSGATSISATIANNAVTDTKFRQSAGLSVVGRSTNTTGNTADITAGSDYNILRRSGTSVGFGSIDLSQSGAVGSSILPIANGGTGGTGGAWSLASGGVITGNNTISGAHKVTFNNSQSGANTIVYTFTPTLTATANTQTITGLDFAMATVDGGFTGLTKVIARFRDSGSTSDALRIISQGTATSQHFIGINATPGTDVPAAPVHVFGAAEGIRISQNAASGTSRISFYQSTTQKADFQGTGSLNTIPNAAIMRSISGPCHFQSNNTDAGGVTATQLWYFGGLFTPVSTVESNGSFGAAIATVTSNTTLTAAHHTVLCDATSGNITITLPSAASSTRRIYVIKKIDSSANTVSFTADGGTITLSAQYEGKQIQSNGSNFYITGSF